MGHTPAALRGYSWIRAEKLLLAGFRVHMDAGNRTRVHLGLDACKADTLPLWHPLLTSFYNLLE